MKSQPLIAAIFGITVWIGAAAIAKENIPDAPTPVAVSQPRIATAQKQINVERARIQKDNNERLSRIRDIEENLGNLRKQLEDPSLSDSKKQTPKRYGSAPCRTFDPPAAGVATAGSRARLPLAAHWPPGSPFKARNPSRSLWFTSSPRHRCLKPSR